MIKVNGVKIEPTRFPDGTTQVWKLAHPSLVGIQKQLKILWQFEREDELLMLAQIRDLFGAWVTTELHVPYLPFARQDKDVSNEATFALRSFARMLNALSLDHVIADDVHNPNLTRKLINNFGNRDVYWIHKLLVERLKPTVVVYPDFGAKERYKETADLHPYVVFEKDRDQATGEIRGLKLDGRWGTEHLRNGMSVLIVDDICDGGRTFLSVAEALRKHVMNPTIDLFVTHGLFSKGRKVLEDAGIRLHTTNSLPRNENEKDVITIC